MLSTLATAAYPPVRRFIRDLESRFFFGHAQRTSGDQEALPLWCPHVTGSLTVNSPKWYLQGSTQYTIHLTPSPYFSASAFRQFAMTTSNVSSKVSETKGTHQIIELRR